MALELTRDLLRFDQIIGEGQSQLLVDRDIIVPDIKPDIARILSVEGKVNITSKDIEQDRIMVEGIVNFGVLYTTDDEPQPIFAMIQGTNISHYIDIIGVMPKMESEIKCSIEHIDFNKLNGRKLNIQCVLNIKGKVSDRISIDMIKEVSGISDVQLLRDTVTIDNTIADNTAQSVIRGTIEIMSDMPPIAEIVKYDTIIHKKEVKVEEGRIEVSGGLLVTAIFSSKDENVDIYKVQQDMAFSHTIDMPGVTPGMLCMVDYNVDDVYTELKENEQDENREIDVEVVVGLRAKAIEKIEYPTIIDAYAPSTRIEAGKKNIVMNGYYGGGSSQVVVKESLPLPENTPEMEKVYDIVCRPIVTDYKTVEDKVIVEGVVGLDVIYLVKGEARLVHSFSEEIPFRHSIVVPGCKIDMKPEAEVSIEHMDYSMLTKNEIEIKILLGCYVKVYEKISKDFIIKLDEIEGERAPKKSSITIYVVQPKDTLWKIAKRYYTTIEDIVKVNEIQDPDKIAIGMKLVIPRKI